MCFGGSPKYEPAPATAVTPAPTATDMAKATAAIPPSTPTASPVPEIVTSAQERRKKIKNLQYGMLSTIKTGPQGITGTGANLYGVDTAGKKTTLGS